MCNKLYVSYKPKLTFLDYKKIKKQLGPRWSRPSRALIKKYLYSQQCKFTTFVEHLVRHQPLMMILLSSLFRVRFSQSILVDLHEPHLCTVWIILHRNAAALPSVLPLFTPTDWFSHYYQSLFRYMLTASLQSSLSQEQLHQWDVSDIQILDFK